MNIFGGKKDDEMKKISENMQNLSNQIATLKQQLVAKDNLVSELQQQLATVTAQAAKGTQGADALQAQIKQLQQQLASAQAERDAETQANEMILKDAQAQMEAMRKQMEAMQTEEAAPGGLAVGASAWVTREGGLPLRLRAGPGLQASVLGQLPPGTRMTLLAGPQQEDGYSWWNIRVEDGREGWVAGNDLRTQPD